MDQSSLPESPDVTCVEVGEIIKRSMIWPFGPRSLVATVATLQTSEVPHDASRQTFAYFCNGLHDCRPHASTCAAILSCSSYAVYRSRKYWPQCTSSCGPSSTGRGPGRAIVQQNMTRINRRRKFILQQRLQADLPSILAKSRQLLQPVAKFYVN